MEKLLTESPQPYAQIQPRQLQKVWLTLRNDIRARLELSHVLGDGRHRHQKLLVFRDNSFSRGQRGNPRHPLIILGRKRRGRRDVITTGGFGFCRHCC